MEKQSNEKIVLARTYLSPVRPREQEYRGSLHTWRAVHESNIVEEDKLTNMEAVWAYCIWAFRDGGDRHGCSIGSVPEVGENKENGKKKVDSGGVLHDGEGEKVEMGSE